MREREAEKAAKDEAVALVERCNDAIAAGHGDLWSPTIETAILAGRPSLDVHCPGCRTCNAIDIGKLDRHPLATVGSLVLGLKCSICRDDAPMSPRLRRRAGSSAIYYPISKPDVMMHCPICRALLNVADTCCLRAAALPSPGQSIARNSRRQGTFSSRTHQRPCLRTACVVGGPGIGADVASTQEFGFGVILNYSTSALDLARNASSYIDRVLPPAARPSRPVYL
jgi:hypothetical protein